MELIKVHTFSQDERGRVMWLEVCEELLGKENGTKPCPGLTVWTKTRGIEGVKEGRFLRRRTWGSLSSWMPALMNSSVLQVSK